LEEHESIAVECRMFRLFAYGPIFPESLRKAKHSHARDIVAALEKALADAMRKAGYFMLNEVNSRKALDLERWHEVTDAFGVHFPALLHGAEL